MVIKARQISHGSKMRRVKSLLSQIEVNATEYKNLTDFLKYDDNLRNYYEGKSDALFNVLASLKSIFCAENEGT